MFKAVYRPIYKTPAGARLLGVPFKEPMPEPVYAYQAFAEGRAGEFEPRVLQDGTFVPGRVLIGLAYG